MINNNIIYRDKDIIIEIILLFQRRERERERENKMPTNDIMVRILRADYPHDAHITDASSNETHIAPTHTTLRERS